MNRSFQIILLAAVAFIVPNSQAILSNAESYDMEYAGYHCSKGVETRQVNIIHQSNNFYVNACKVTFQKNNQQQKILLDEQRNNDSCKNAAGNMAIRLKDRGWYCKTAGLSLEEIPHSLQYH